jgi:hypothetical protein
MDQVAIDEDAEGLRAQSRQEERQNMLDDNMMLFGMTHRKLIAINAHQKFGQRPGEVCKERPGTPLSDNLTIRQNAEAASKPIAADLDLRRLLAGDVDGEAHEKLSAGTTIMFG